MKVPCAECPFRRKGGVRLRQGRVKEIAGMMLDWHGGTFLCHKSIDYGERDPSSEVHCAGALIFAEKHGGATQLMRIAGHLGLYDPAVFTEEAKAEVFDSIEEMLAVNRREQP